MKRFYLLILALLLPMLLPFALRAQEEVADSLMAQLKFCRTPADSIKLLYNVFDATPYRKKLAPGKMVLDIARRTDNQDALSDFIPQVATIGVKDSLVVAEMLDWTKYLADEERRKTCRLYILVKKAAEEANYIPEADLQKVLMKYAREDMTPKGDFYEDLLDLYRMVIFIGNRSNGNLYLEYLTRLEDMIKKIPQEEFPYLMTLFYTTAANVHTRNGNHEKAIEMDKILLKIIGNLEDRYEKMGRQYRDYSRYYYICYRRMLSNYPALTNDEVKELFVKCAQLAEKNKEVEGDFYEGARPFVYRLMAFGDYAGAVPRLKQSIARANDKYSKMRMLRMLVAASDSIGDRETLLSALKEYSQYLGEVLDAQSEEAYQELQIRYDLNHLKAERDELETEKRDAEAATNQRVIIVALLGVLVLAVALMFLYRSNFSLKRRVRDTMEENFNLHHTIEDMLGDSALKSTLNVRQSGKRSADNGKRNPDANTGKRSPDANNGKRSPDSGNGTPHSGNGTPDSGNGTPHSGKDKN